MRSKLVLLAFLLAGCAAAHTEERAKNAAEDAQYGLELQACYDAAITTNQTQGPTAAQQQYELCATAADQKHGKK